MQEEFKNPTWLAVTGMIALINIPISLIFWVLTAGQQWRWSIVSLIVFSTCFVTTWIMRAMHDEKHASVDQDTIKSFQERMQEMQNEKSNQ